MAIGTLVLGLVMVVFHNPLGEFLPIFFRNDRHSQIAYLVAGIFLTVAGISLSLQLFDRTTMYLILLWFVLALMALALVAIVVLVGTTWRGARRERRRRKPTDHR
jgi:hypothetical protein